MSNATQGLILTWADLSADDARRHPLHPWLAVRVRVKGLDSADPVAHALRPLDEWAIDGRGYPQELTRCGVRVDGLLMPTADRYHLAATVRPCRRCWPQVPAGEEWVP